MQLKTTRRKLRDLKHYISTMKTLQFNDRNHVIREKNTLCEENEKQKNEARMLCSLLSSQFDQGAASIAVWVFVSGGIPEKF